MFFIIQIALPRDRVFCGYRGGVVAAKAFEPVWSNTTGGRAVMYETQDEANEEAALHPGSVVCELVFCE